MPVTPPGSLGSDNDTIKKARGTPTQSTQVVEGLSKPPTKELGHGGNSIVPWMDIVDVYEEVPELAWPASIALFDRMRKDAQLEAVLRALTLPIRRYSWHIIPNGARDEVVEDIAHDFGLPIQGIANDEAPMGRMRNRFNHDDHLRHCFLALPFGYMFFEQFGIIEDDSFKFRLRKLAPRMPGTIMKIKVARDGGLTSIVQYPAGYGPMAGPGDNPAGIEIKNERLVAYINEREGGNWVGRSVFRAVYKNWLIKDRLLRVDALKHERNGMGVPWIEAPPGATVKQIKDMSALAQSYMAGDQSGGALPNGSKLHLQGVEGSIPDTIASIRYHDQQMARIFLEMFLELGTTATGSRALSGSFIDFFSMAQEAYADWYVTTTNAYVIEDIVDWNYGPEEQAPRIGYDKAEDKGLAVADLVALVNAGAIVVDQETEDWIRDRWTMPQTDTPRPEVVTPASEGGGGNGPVVQPTATAPRPRRSVWRKLKAAVVGEPPAVPLPDRKLRRAPTAIEASARTDFARIEAEFVTALEALMAEIEDIQGEQLDELGAQIAEAIDAEDWAALGSIAPTATTVVALTDHMQAMAERAALTAVAEAAAQGTTLTVPTIPAETIAARATAIGSLLSSALVEVTGRKALAFASPGQTGSEVAAAVLEYVNELTDSYLHDRLTGALMSAQNEGRYAVWQQTSNATFYASELLDTATCDPCALVDGQSYADLDAASEDYPAGGYVDCDGGERCRGTLVAVMGTESEPGQGTGEEV